MMAFWISLSFTAISLLVVCLHFYSRWKLKNEVKK